MVLIGVEEWTPKFHHAKGRPRDQAKGEGRHLEVDKERLTKVI